MEHRRPPRLTLRAASAAAVVFALAGGCRVHYDGSFTPPRPILVTAQPPPAPVEEKPNAPYDGAVWIEGHHEWTVEGWVWLPGSYVRPRAGHHWVSPRYEHSDQRVRYVPGYWEPSPAGGTPPPPQPPPPVVVPSQPADGSMAPGPGPFDAGEPAAGSNVDVTVTPVN